MFFRVGYRGGNGSLTGKLVRERGPEYIRKAEQANQPSKPSKQTKQAKQASKASKQSKQAKLESVALSRAS